MKWPWGRKRSPFGKPIKPLGRDDPGGRYYDVAVKSLNIANHVGHELTLRRRQDGKVELICMSDGPYSDSVKAIFVPRRAQAASSKHKSHKLKVCEVKV